jgi:uncharacterized protein (TIGR02118 family)
MVKITVLYPNIKGRRFVIDYYLNVHMPMSIEKLGATMKGVTVEIGIGGAHEGTPPPYVALCHFLFETVDAFMKAFMPHAELLMGDIVNYTDIGSVIQISEVRIHQVN